MEASRAGFKFQQALLDGNTEHQYTLVAKQNKQNPKAYIPEKFRRGLVLEAMEMMWIFEANIEASKQTHG